MARSPRMRKGAIALANLLLPCAVLLFASGFFPYKPVLPGLAVFEEHDASSMANPVFQRVVFMVVDALRSDFVYGPESGFAFTQSLIRSGAAIPFTAHATPPTVTMPRVKALTTGSVPSFLDLILNFAESDTSSSLAAQDTWLAQIRAKGGNIVFYGDDTWLKLFPTQGFFLRHDGTSSFFVSDFTEVDNNVTRHVPEELRRDDWNAMVMHYLGLDHIGHKTGPHGPNMLPKQREMDEIVKSIYQAMESEAYHQDTLLVLAGDHGMNAGGNHGGSGPGETEPALLFASPKFKTMPQKGTYECPTTPKQGTEFHYYTKVEQSDLVPTLAGLMGLPISRNSLGVSIPELSVAWQDHEKVDHLMKNAEQLLQIIEATYGQENFQSGVDRFTQTKTVSVDVCDAESEDEQRLSCLWACVKNWKLSRESISSQEATITKFLLEAQDSLSGTASSYNIPRMVIGMALTAGTLVLTLLSLEAIWPPSAPGTFLTLLTVLYGVMMFASSYVEEEQHFWYWATPAWIATLSVHTAAKAAQYRRFARLAISTLAVLAVHRFAIRWNQTGQKHAGEADIVHTFFPDAHVLMWLLILITYSYNGLLLFRRTFAGIMGAEVAVLNAVLLVVPAVIFKLNFTHADAPELVQGLASQLRVLTEQTNLVVQARISFSVQAIAMIVVVALSTLSAHESKNAGLRDAGLLPTLSERLHHLLTLFLMMQTRAPNIPLLLGFEIQRQALAYVVDLAGGQKRARVAQVATSTLLLSHVYFFCMGGSNSISSIDLSNAYNGVADYNIAAVGVLLFASNWTGPIWWCSAANLLLSPQVRLKPKLDKEKSKSGRSWVDEERETLLATMGPEKSKSQSDAIASDEDFWLNYVSLMTVFVSTSLLAVMAACTALRTHLFIWTVFSPKYLYAMAWSVVWHLIINIGFGSLLRIANGVS